MITVKKLVCAGNFYLKLISDEQLQPRNSRTKQSRQPGVENIGCAGVMSES